MQVKQFYDNDLAHASYGIESKGQMAVVDPARDPEPYYQYAKELGAKIVAVIETHPHADFVSSHQEIHQATGAIIYVSKMVAADYPHQGFDQGDELKLGDITLKPLNTPGHSPDSISIVATDENGKDQYVFTGDTLFIGDVGRPDLREKAGNMTAKREELARQMYHSTRDILMKLEKDVVVYPAHGAGSLCGKNLSDELDSTIGKELQQNAALQQMSEEEFVDFLLQDQPFIPKYFSYNVAVNKAGAANYKESVNKVPKLKSVSEMKNGVLIVDSREGEEFKKGHLPGAINLIANGKFETWLGSVIDPEEPFYLIAEDEKTLNLLIERAAKIGYEKSIKGGLAQRDFSEKASPLLNLTDFKQHPENYTIIDVRNPAEVKEGEIFTGAKHIPLNELRDRAKEIEQDKPVVVHCAGGYRSAAGSSILQTTLPIEVYDLGADVKSFQTQMA
jgi:hydroxyacylglutathione hydrolase